MGQIFPFKKAILGVFLFSLVSFSSLATSSNIEALLEDYATHLAQRQATHVEWCDLYGKHTEAGSYKISFEPLGILYDTPLDPPERHPTILFQQWFDNRAGTTAQKSTITRTETTMSTFSWTTTRGLKATTSVTGEVRFPFLGKMETTVGGELEFTKEKALSKEVTQSWEISQEISVPPKTASKMTYLVEELEYTLPFLSLIRISGTYAARTSKALFPIKIGEVFKDQAYLRKNPGYYVDKTDQSVLFVAEGLFNARHGVSSSVQVQDYPADLSIADLSLEEHAPLPGSFQRLDVEAFNEGGLEVKLGQAYLSAEDYSAAFKWLRRAAQKDQTAALTTLGWLLLEGRGVNANEGEAFKLFRRAAAQNDAEALHTLGWLLLHGRGTPRDEVAAFNFFKRAADQGHAQAANNLGVMLLKGLGGLAKPEEALVWLQRAALQEEPAACSNLCWVLITKESLNLKEALKWYQKAQALGQEEGLSPLQALPLKLSLDEALRLLQERANHGEINAYITLGWIYQNGVGVNQDDTQALTWYIKAGRSRSPDALYALGKMSEQGLGTPQDYEKAFKLYKAAAEQNHAEAQFALGNLYEQGLGLPKDKDKALEYYKLAAEQGHAEAQAKVRSLQEESLNSAGLPKSLRDLQEAAEQGNAQAQYKLGVMYQTGTGAVEQNYKKAVEYYKRAADQDHAQAQCNLGGMYEDGLGVAQDYAEALKYYRKAAAQGDKIAQNKIRWLQGEPLKNARPSSETLKHPQEKAGQGDAEAQYKLGMMYQEGTEVRRDYKKAVECYRKAADQGHAAAQCNLGVMYLYGLGVPSNPSEAVKYFRKLADQGYAHAQFLLSLRYGDGLGVKKDHAEAVKYCRKAADQGHAAAQYNLGFIYHYGCHKVEKNYGEALKWYKLSAAQGNLDAQKAVRKLARKGYV